jgi:class 3 adenylate cyclase/tetratricopeptide (TPR) repeat protein
VKPAVGASVGLGLPVALREHLSAGAIESEHRLATVGFIRFGGVDGLLSASGPPAVADALDRLVCAVQAAVDAEGVTFLASDIDAGGGKIILATGVPGAQDDDEGRMLRALRAIAETPLPLTLQIGVNGGHVFAGVIGTDFRQTFTIIGDTVNLAARLMAAAPPGEIYATAQVLDRSRSLFATEAVPPFTVKGKSAPVQAYQVGDDRGSRSRLRSSSPFVGRRSEFDQLERAWSSAVTGQGQVVVVEADRGLGKSRLVDELRTGLADAMCLVLQCEPYGAGTPYQPFRRPLRALFGLTSDDPVLAGKELNNAIGAIDPDALPLTPLLAPLIGVALDDTEASAAIAPEFRRDRTVDLIVRLYDRASLGPMLLVVEDGHWLDEAACGFVERLASEGRTRPWLLIVTRRPVATGLRLVGDETIALEPLPPDAARQLVDEVTAAAPIRPYECEAIVARAGGNPLFVEELLQVARSSGAASLPESLDGVANAMIDGLSPADRQVLRHASVLGTSFDTAVLVELLAEADLESGSAVWHRLRDFLESDGPGRLRFRHALHREAAYEGLAYRRRRELHQLAGQTIEAMAGDQVEASSSALSLHFSRAQLWPSAWRYCRLAGQLAKEAYAPAETALHLERCLEAARRLPGVPATEVASVWRDLGDARLILGYYDQAEAAYSRGATLVAADRPAWAMHVEQRAYVLGEHQGRHRSAIRLLHRALAQLDGMPGDAAEVARIWLLAREAEVRSRQNRFNEALRIAAQVIERAERVGVLAALAIGYNVTDGALNRLGRVGEADHMGLALQAYEQLGDQIRVGIALGNMGATAYFGGRWDHAAELYDRAVGVLNGAGDINNAAIYQANLGELLASQGHLEEARSALTPAARTFHSLGLAVYEQFTSAQLGRVAAQLGMHGEAQQHFSRAIELEDAAGGPESGIEARCMLAEAHVLAGRPDEALSQVVALRASVGYALAGTPTGAMLGRIEAMALVAAGNTTEFLERFAGASAHARAACAYYDLAILLSLRCGLPGASPELAAERDLLIGQLGVAAMPALSPLQSQSRAAP